MGETISFLTNVPGGMGRITPSSCASSFMITPDSMAGRLALLMPPADAACSAAEYSVSFKRAASPGVSPLAPNLQHCALVGLVITPSTPAGFVYITTCEFFY